MLIVPIVVCCCALLCRGVDAGRIQQVAGEDVEVRDDSDSDEKSAENPENTNTTACEKCLEWHSTDKEDTKWLKRLNAVIQCPCRTKGAQLGHALSKDLRSEWTHDPNCTAHGRPNCSTQHPGADGCLLSNATLRRARQHCCYSGKGKLLGPDHPGVGTPRRETEGKGHYKKDVLPRRWCCVECGNRDYCNYYRLLRHSSNSHCNDNLDWVKWNLRYGYRSPLHP